MKTYEEKLKARYPEFAKWSKKKLKIELQMIRDFIEDKHSSIGRQDFYYEHALSYELLRRGEKLEDVKNI